MSPEEMKAVSRRAIERVCSGRELEQAGECYGQDFLDHVNSADFQGMDGIRHSVSAYVQLFPDLVFTVEDQVAEGDRVASRWTMTGTQDGKRVSVGGITISRFQDGRIAEDWTRFDSGDLARQLQA